jgi:hypothetical protein
MLSDGQLKRLRDRAYHWWEWAAGIRAASELETALASPQIKGSIMLLDTSEIVEYARPSSLLRNEYPTRLDLSLNLIFAPGELVYMTGPHGREVRGVSQGWQEHMNMALLELKSMRERLGREKLTALNEDLNRIYAFGLRSQATQLLELLRENYRWLFSETRLRPPSVFDRLLARLYVPSGNEFGIPAGWQYQPDHARIEWWQQRLNDTGLGNQEPGPNYVDALALDQVEQVAKVSSKVPILLTHSGKIFEALRVARKDEQEFFRRDGISLVQPPQMVLVSRLRKDAAAAGRLDQLNEELTRQQARGEAVYNQVREVDGSGQVTDTSWGYEQIEHDIEEFESSWRQWEALRQVLLSFEQPEDKTPGILGGLEKILTDTAPDDAAYFQRLLMAELDELIAKVDRLQAQIANRLAPPAIPEEMDLQPEAAEEIANPVVRLRAEPRIRSASYPIRSFRFSDPQIVAYLYEIAHALETLKKHPSSETRTRVNKLWRDARGNATLRTRPELFLLSAGLYLTQEKWMQAYDVATRGLDLLRESGEDAAQSSVGSELLLARAGAGRAFVHALRMDFPLECQTFMQGAVEDCLLALEAQRGRGDLVPDRRCLRELAVTFCASHDPVYGPRDPAGPRATRKSIELHFDRERFPDGISIKTAKDPLLLAEVFARNAYSQKGTNPDAELMFANTHLYVMTDIDRRWLDAGEQNMPQYERERIDLARLLDSERDDPNFTDTLMWHCRVLAETRKRQRDSSWQTFDDRARELAATLDEHPGLAADTNQYYFRLVQYHKTRVRKLIH